MGNRKAALKEAIEIVLDKIQERGGLIDAHSFDGVINYYRNMIFEGVFTEDAPYGNIHSFTSEFKGKLKKAIFQKFPHLKNLVELNINRLVAELENNTEIFVKKRIKRQKKVLRFFNKIKKLNVNGFSPKVRINKYAEVLFREMTRNGLKKEDLDDILLVEQSIDDLIGFLVDNNKVIPLKQEVSDKERTRILDECKFKFQQQVEKRKQSYYSRISLLEKKNEEKIAAKQDRYEAEIIQFIEKLIDQCKLEDIYSYNDVTKYVVHKLLEKNIFTYKSVNVIAPKILAELKKQPTIFPELTNVSAPDFLDVIRLQSEVIEKHNSEKRQLAKQNRRSFFNFFKNKKETKARVYQNFEELQKSLLEQVKNGEFTEKDMLDIYVPELVDNLIKSELLIVPSFSTEEEYQEFINAKKQQIIQEMVHGIYEFRKDIVGRALYGVAHKEKYASTHSNAQLETLITKIKDNKLFKGRLHYNDIEMLIIEKIWGMTKEIDPKEYKKIRNIYRQVLLNSYEKETSNLQFKLKLSNKVGFAFSCASALIGVYGFLALLISALTLPVVGSVPILATAAIFTSLSGLAMSSYASTYTTKKDIAQDIIDKTIGEQRADVYRELFAGIPNVSELVVGLHYNPLLRSTGVNNYNIHFEFIEHLRNLDPARIKSIISEINARNIDITSENGKKKLFKKLIDRMKTAINAKIDYYEEKSNRNAYLSLRASQGTFTLGTAITASSIVAEAVTGAPVAASSTLGQVLGWAGAAITGTGGVSIVNAYKLDNRKKNHSKPLINLRTNLNLLSSYIEEEKAHIVIPENICSAYNLDSADVNHFVPIEKQKAAKENSVETSPTMNKSDKEISVKKHSLAQTSSNKPASFTQKLERKNGNKSFVKRLEEESVVSHEQANALAQR